MSVLVVKDLTVYYGEVLILDRLSLQIGAGEKVALIGYNGTGKTTLLKAIAGKLRPDEGSIVCSGGVNVHYLEQEPNFPPEATLFEAVSQVFEPLKDMEAELRRLEEQMGCAEGDLGKIMRKYSHLTDEFERLGGYEWESRVKTVLAGVGFPPDKFYDPVSILSGGQRVRASLAKALLEEPELLLLDEPTNHLDLDAVEWLESFMPGYRGAVLLVSHDRHFLDKVVSRCLELEDHRLIEYSGNFSKYRALKAQRMAQQGAIFEREQTEMQRMGAWISRFKAGTRSTLAKSMEKKLSRLSERAVSRPAQRQRLKLNVVEKKRSGRDVLDLYNVEAGFDKMLFKPFSCEVRRGERIALLGPNGSGKTTLLRALIGKLPVRGEVKWSLTAHVGYFDQQLALLHPSGRVIDEVMAYAGLTEKEARAHLARFLFRGDLVWQSVTTLSGGERNRLAMAKLLLSGFNVLILDEPTNHLDIESREVLERALQLYPGTILFVSHDRYFLNRLATRVWQFTDGRIVDHKQNYSDWRAGLLRPRLQPERRETRRPNVPKGGQIQALENEIERLELEKSGYEEEMAQSEFFKNPGGGKNIVNRYGKVCARLKDLYEEWERLVE
jgi:ATP-binding cassette subfamily F protein 3